MQSAYVYQGPYDPTSDIPDDDLDPGDHLVAVLLAGWQPSHSMTARAFVAYSHFLADTTNGRKSFRLGDKVVLGTDMDYVRGPLGLTVSLQVTVQGKNGCVRDEEDPFWDSGTGEVLPGLLQKVGGNQDIVASRV